MKAKKTKVSSKEKTKKKSKTLEKHSESTNFSSRNEANDRQTFKQKTQKTSLLDVCYCFQENLNTEYEEKLFRFQKQLQSYCLCEYVE
jgi:hypothetical protein